MYIGENVVRTTSFFIQFSANWHKISDVRFGQLSTVGIRVTQGPHRLWKCLGNSDFIFIDSSSDLRVHVIRKA